MPGLALSAAASAVGDRSWHRIIAHSTKRQERLSQAKKLGMLSGSLCEGPRSSLRRPNRERCAALSGSRQTNFYTAGGSAGILRPQTPFAIRRLLSSFQGKPFPPERSVRVVRIRTATRVHSACNRATARCIASTSAAVVSSFPLLHIPLKAAPSSITILSYEMSPPTCDPC